MTKDEERREVAKRLRDKLDYCNKHSVWEDEIVGMINDSLHGSIYGDAYYVISRLADLIDRQTCHIVQIEPGWWECDECGCSIDWDDCYEPPNCTFCPNCGSEVVSEDV